MVVFLLVANELAGYAPLLCIPGVPFTTITCTTGHDARVLNEDLVVFRAEGRWFGKFYGTTKPTSAADAEKLYNVADYGNDLLEVSTCRIPKGTTVNGGAVAGGRAMQVVFPNPRDAGVQLLEKEPLAQYDHS